MSAPPLEGAAGVDGLPNENEVAGADAPGAGAGAAVGLLLKENPLPNGLAAGGAAGVVLDAGAEGVDDDPNENPVDAWGAGVAELEAPNAKPPKGDALAGVLVWA